MGLQSSQFLNLKCPKLIFASQDQKQWEYIDSFAGAPHAGEDSRGLCLNYLQSLVFCSAVYELA